MIRRKRILKERARKSKNREQQKLKNNEESAIEIKHVKDVRSKRSQKKNNAGQKSKQVEKSVKENKDIDDIYGKMIDENPDMFNKYKKAVEQRKKIVHIIKTTKLEITKTQALYDKLKATENEDSVQLSNCLEILSKSRVILKKNKMKLINIQKNLPKLQETYQALKDHKNDILKSDDEDENDDIEEKKIKSKSVKIEENFDGERLDNPRTSKIIWEKIIDPTQVKLPRKIQDFFENMTFWKLPKQETHIHDPEVLIAYRQIREDLLRDYKLVDKRLYLDEIPELIKEILTHDKFNWENKYLVKTFGDGSMEVGMNFSKPLSYFYKLDGRSKIVDGKLCSTFKMMTVDTVNDKIKRTKQCFYRQRNI